MTDSPDASTLRLLHRTIEHYTPDGPLGRLLLGAILLGGGISAFPIGMFTLLNPVSLASFLAGMVFTPLGAAAVVVGLTALWPVYLSLIGNVDAPADYPEGATPPSTRGNETSPAEVLKRRYAEGEIDREEFERRLDDLVNPGDEDSARDPERQRDRELIRNR